MGSKCQADELNEALAQYETQLNQIKSAITATNSGPEHDNLVSLKSDIEELIRLTKENLQNLLGQTTNGSIQDETEEDDPFSREYALFKAEIEKEANENQLNEVDDNDNSNDQASAIEDIKNELASLQGSKCQAPYKHKWDEGKSSHHNALVMSVEDIEGPTSDIQDILVRVMFVNPVHKKMVPCPYYLEGDCKFLDDKCHYSHGELIPLADLKEYKEPDFSSIKIGSRVLAKHKDNLWHHANVVEIISDDIIKVKFHTNAGGTIEIDLHEVLPLDSNSNNSENSIDGACTSGSTEENSSGMICNRSFSGNDDNLESSSSDNDSDNNDCRDEIDRESIIQLSLLRTPTSSVMGNWEKHTKGIGSRLMASMGYIAGSGLGPRGDGRLEPVEAVVFPPGKSLDHCMDLREAAGGDSDMFKAEKRRLKIQMIEDKRREREYEKEKQKVDVFSFINNQLSGTSSGNDEEASEVNKSKQLASSSRKGLNVERFRISEDIRRAEKDLIKIKESLKRHQTGSTVHKHLSNKLLFAESELNKLQASERSIAKEQNKRDSTKKLAVF